MTWSIRDTLKPDDPRHIRKIVASTGFFSEAEIVMAVELVNEALTKGEASGYCFIMAEQYSDVLGYTCFGPIAGTQSSYDLYWIAVHQKMRGQGVGQELLRHTETRVAAQSGTRMYIETSSRDQYAPTRQFYRRCGYQEAARLNDFYAPGDGKVIYVKIL